MELLLLSATITTILMLGWGLFTLSKIHRELSSIRKDYFMLMLYARQNAKFNVLVDILKSRGVLEAGDLEAFRQAAMSEAAPADWLEEAWREYQCTAASLGITTGLGASPLSARKEA